MNVADRVKETTNATSTATISLAGSVEYMRRFSAAFAVGSTGIPVSVDDGSGNWESGAYTLSGTSTLTRTKIYESSNGGNAVTFPAGAKTVSCTPCAGWFEDFAQLSEGITVQDLPRGVPKSADLIAFASASGGDLAITYADFLALINGNPPASDTTGPSLPDALSSSSITQTSFNLAWQAATDASGIARYEYSYDGSTWTTAGTALSVNLTGRTAGTTYTMRVRAIDPSGNISTVRTLAVTTAAASGDTQAPSMSGSIVVTNQTSSGYTFSYSAGSDNVSVDHYETSIDGGASFQNNGTALGRIVTGRPAGTTDSLRVRAHDAAGNISNVLTGSATTTSAPPAAATLSKAGAAKNQTASTTGASNVTTDKAGGQLYRLISANATETAATIKAANLSQAVTVAGNQRVNLTGLPTSGANYLHQVHTDASGADSNVVSTQIYVIRPSSSNSVKAQILPSTGTASAEYLYYGGTDGFANLYWIVDPAPGAGVVRGGWGLSDTVEPPVFLGNENASTGGKQNGLVLLNQGGTGTTWNAGTLNGEFFDIEHLLLLGRD